MTGEAASGGANSRAAARPEIANVHRRDHPRISATAAAEGCVVVRLGLKGAAMGAALLFPVGRMCYKRASEG
jgi:hypothetical protein